MHRFDIVPVFGIVEKFDRMFTLQFKILEKDLTNQSFIWFSRGNNPLNDSIYTLDQFLINRTFIQKEYPIFKSKPIKIHL
jgi:hypothetical protein